MPIVVGKSVNFLQTKFIPNAGQIYPRLRAPDLKLHLNLKKSLYS